MPTFNYTTGLYSGEEGYTPEAVDVSISTAGLPADADAAEQELLRRKKELESLRRAALERQYAEQQKENEGDGRPFVADNLGAALGDLVKAPINALAAIPTDLVDLGLGAVDIAKGLGERAVDFVSSGGKSGGDPLSAIQTIAEGNYGQAFSEAGESVEDTFKYYDDADNPLTTWREQSLGQFESGGGQLFGTVLRGLAGLVSFPKIGVAALSKGAKIASAISKGDDAADAVRAASGIDDLLKPFKALQVELTAAKVAPDLTKSATKLGKQVADNPAMYGRYATIAKAAVKNPDVKPLVAWMDDVRGGVKDALGSVRTPSNFRGPDSFASAAGWDAFVAFNMAGEGNSFNDETLSDFIMTTPELRGLQAFASPFSTRIEDSSIDRKIKQMAEGTVLNMGLSSVIGQIKAMRFATEFKKASAAEKALILSKFDSQAEGIGADILRPLLPPEPVSQGELFGLDFAPGSGGEADLVEAIQRTLFDAQGRPSLGTIEGNRDLIRAAGGRYASSIPTAPPEDYRPTTNELANITSFVREAQLDRARIQEDLRLQGIDEEWFAEQVKALEAGPQGYGDVGEPKDLMVAPPKDIVADFGMEGVRKGDTRMVPSPPGPLVDYPIEPVTVTELPTVRRPVTPVPSPEVIRRSAEEQYRRAQAAGVLDEMIEGPDGVMRNKVQQEILVSIKSLMPSSAVDMMDYAMANPVRVNNEGVAEAITSTIRNIAIRRGIAEGWVEIGDDLRPRFIRAKAVDFDRSALQYEEAGSIDDALTLQAFEIDQEESLKAAEQEGAYTAADISADQGIVEAPISQTQTLDLANAEMGLEPANAEMGLEPEAVQGGPQDIQAAATQGANAASVEQAQLGAAEEERLMAAATAPPAQLSDEDAVRQFLGSDIDALPAATVERQGTSQWIVLDDDGNQIGSARTKVGAEAIANKQNSLNRERAVARARVMATDNVGQTAPTVTSSVPVGSADLAARMRITRPQAQALSGLSPELDEQLASSALKRPERPAFYNINETPAFYNINDAPKIPGEGSITLSQSAMIELRDGLRAVIANGEVTGSRLSMLKRMADKFDTEIQILEPRARADLYTQRLIDENARLMAYGRNCTPI